MLTYFNRINQSLLLAFFIWFAQPLQLFAQNKDVSIIIHIRGVYDSKISLLALSVSKTFKPIIEVPAIKNGETTKLTVTKDHLPGEFVLRFDYKEKETSAPYPSEKYIFINDQELELWVRPEYCNNADSTYFQKSEKENSTYAEFSKENGRQKEKLALLQNFLMNYDDTESKFFKQGIKEYEQRRKTYNDWLKNMIQKDKALFVSNLYHFQYVPENSWKGNEHDRILNLIAHYFDGMDFNHPSIIKTSELNKWMDHYVNLYGQLSVTPILRDSLFPLAGRTAIERARKGDPQVYGWMVDYFYKGYESNGISAGTKILEPYMNDPNCLTTKRQEINRRLKGIETLVQGSRNPEISIKDTQGNLFELSQLSTDKKYILLLFWSAGCSHCMELINDLYPWYQQDEIGKKMNVIAISLDESESEVKKWVQKTPDLQEWKHLRAPDGIRSKVAADYYILSTPVMVLIDSKTRKIVSLPNTFKELKSFVY